MPRGRQTGVPGSGRLDFWISTSFFLKVLDLAFEALEAVAQGIIAGEVGVLPDEVDVGERQPDAMVPVILPQPEAVVEQAAEEVEGLLVKVTREMGPVTGRARDVRLDPTPAVERLGQAQRLSPARHGPGAENRAMTSCRRHVCCVWSGTCAKCAATGRKVNTPPFAP